MQRGQLFDTLTEVMHQLLLQLLQSLALRNVAHDADDRSCSRRIQRANPDLHREFSAVRAFRGERAGDRACRRRSSRLDAGAKTVRCCFYILCIPMKPRSMHHICPVPDGFLVRVTRGEEAFRYGRFHIPPDQFRPRESEHPLRFVVDLRDTAVVVDDENRIRRGVDETTEMALALVAPFHFRAKMVVGRRQFRSALSDALVKPCAFCGERIDGATSCVVQRADQNGDRHKCRQLNQSGGIESDRIDRRDEKIIGGDRTEKRRDESRAEAADPGAEHHRAEKKRVGRSGPQAPLTEEAERQRQRREQDRDRVSADAWHHRRSYRGSAALADAMNLRGSLSRPSSNRPDNDAARDQPGHC